LKTKQIVFGPYVTSHKDSWQYLTRFRVSPSQCFWYLTRFRVRPKNTILRVRYTSRYRHI
jgi:hypothetical protein